MRGGTTDHKKNLLGEENACKGGERGQRRFLNRQLFSYSYGTMSLVLQFVSLLSLLALARAVSQQDSPVVGIISTPASDCGAPPPGFNGTTCVER